MGNLERQIKNCFIANSSMFPTKISANDFQLREVIFWFGNVKGKKILDAGCGKGRFVKALAKRGGLLTGIDFVEGFIKIANENVQEANFKLASVNNIPFETATFDGVLCIEVMEHIPNAEKAVKEMVRVLKPGGKLIIIDKNILSLHYRYLIPTFLFKRVQELCGKWMYPNNFPFREKYFTLKELNIILKRYCSTVKSKYLPTRSRRLKMICNLFPVLSYDIVWRGIK